MITKFKIFENADHSDVDPYGEEIWDEVTDIIERGYLFRNFYRCRCGTEWIDEWDLEAQLAFVSIGKAICDDECPNCGTIMTPYQSEDI